MMGMNGFPTLSLRMEGMQYSMLQVLHEHHQEIEAEVERQFKQLFEGDSIERFVRDAIAPVMRGILADSMKSAIHKALWSNDVKSILEGNVHEAMMKVLREYYPGSEPDFDEKAKAEEEKKWPTK